MGRASQTHKLDIHGSNSLGERKALSRIGTQHGSDTVAAVLILDGLWGSGDTITVNTNIGASNVVSAYTPSGNENATAAATGLAAIINAQTDHTATGVLNTVRVTKTTAGSVDIVSAVIT